MGRRLALVIATYDYQDAGLAGLTAPAHDAEDLAAVLRDPAVAGFEVTTLVNQPMQAVGRAISAFYKGSRGGDLTLLYFSGHGLKDEDGQLYLAMCDTMLDHLRYSGLSADSIDHDMSASSSRQKVLILDCCYSGAFGTGRARKGDTAVHALAKFTGRGRTVLTASDSTQYSFEGDKVSGDAPRSVFTRHLIAGLRDGSADLDGDGDITIDELYSYVHDRVVLEMPQQRPQKKSDVEGRTVIARNVNWTLPPWVADSVAGALPATRLAAVDTLAGMCRTGNDIVRARVLAELEHLAADDSRQVSTAAKERLAALLAGAPPPPAPEPAPPPPEPARPAPEPAPPPPEPRVEAPPQPSEPAPTPDPAPPGPPRLRKRPVVAAGGAALLLAALIAIVAMRWGPDGDAADRITKPMPMPTDSASATRSPSPSVPATEMPTPTPSPRPSTQPPPVYDCDNPVGEGYAAKFSVERLGREFEHDRRADVWLAQRKLYEKDYLRSRTSCDGKFGPATQAAVEAYQRQIKMEPFGYIGPNTWKALVRDIPYVPPPPTPTPTVTPTPFITPSPHTETD